MLNNIYLHVLMVALGLCGTINQATAFSDNHLVVLEPSCSPAPMVCLTIETTPTQRRMAGGIGASWHAVRVARQFDGAVHYRYDVRHVGSQGSAVGANPPLDSPAWEDIDRLGKWLGLDWLRVELSRRMYEPQKGRFDWDNEEMRTLYRILDWCEQNEVDVFLTEMYRDVDWLAYPEVHPLLSAPNSQKDFAEGLAVLADHLIRQKHYTCIKWLCVANEPPGGTWGYWWSRGPDNAPLGPAIKAVREALDSRGIALPLSGPDWTDLPKLDPAKLDFAQCLAAFDLHSYSAPNDGVSRKFEEWSRWAHQQGKPFFITELGDMSLGWGTNNPGPRSFDAVLSNAEKILRGLNAGVDGFSRWSFLNRGDLDGQWQLVRTWNSQAGCFLTHAETEPVPFYGCAMLTRFTAKHSEVLPCQWQFQTNATAPPRIFAAALRSPRSQLTLILANRENMAIDTHIRWQRLGHEIVLHRYELTEKALQVPDFKISSAGQVGISAKQPEFSNCMPPRSLVVFTTYNLNSEEPGIISETPQFSAASPRPLYKRSKQSQIVE
jgi:hypothetical protein